VKKSCSLPGILQFILKPTSLFIIWVFVLWLVNFKKVHSDKSTDKGDSQVFFIHKQFLLKEGFAGNNSKVLKKNSFSDEMKVHPDRLSFIILCIRTSFCLTHSFLSEFNAQYILFQKFTGHLEPVIIKYHFVRGP